MPLYAINLGTARLFVDSPFSIFSNFKFVMIYVFSIWMNKWILIFSKKKKKFFSVQKYFSVSHITS
jgi:hypothetical protein